MALRRFFGILSLFTATLAIVTAALWLAPAFFQQFPQDRTLPFALAIGAVLAMVILLVAIVVNVLTSPEEARPPYDPTRVALDFSQRLVGVKEEAQFAQVTGEMLVQSLKVHRSGWLLLDSTANATTVAVRAVPGHGSFPSAPSELARSNPLLRLVTQKRAPVLHAEVDIEKMPAAERDWVRVLGVEAYAPVFDTGVLIAILAIGPKSDGKPFLRSDLDLLALLAALGSPSLRSTRTMAHLHQATASVEALNVSLREKSHAVEKIDSSRSDFLAIASHELRTPITQLLGFADLLGAMAEDNTLDRESVKPVTDSIVRACERLNEVVNQIMDMAQLDSNTLELRFKETTLEHLLRLALEPYVPAMRARQLALKLIGLKGMPPLQVDEQRMAHALSQLASNAIKYTPDGGQIEVSVRMLAPEGNLPPCAQITFADSGIGIDAQYHALIFEKFYRIGSSAQHTTSTTKFMGGGPGLGLPIAKGIIERHGGRLWVESAGHNAENLPGSRFHVVVPIKPPAFDPRALEDATKAGNSGMRGTRPVPRTDPFIPTLPKS